MSARGLLTPDVSYAEFGAGKGHTVPPLERERARNDTHVGKLSHWVQNAIGNTAPAKFILIDRQNCRNKARKESRFFNDKRSEWAYIHKIDG